jgi:dTDP-4-amino-4,6-dideoxygalactose transaminase
VNDGNSSIPQTNPHAGYLAYKDEIDEAVSRVLNGGRYILGEEVASFEREFAAEIGAPHAIGVGNGTDALLLALRACAIGPGDLVFTVSQTAVATIAAIELAGATPVLIDIDPVSYTMDPDLLEETVKNTKRGTAKAIVPVHLYGNVADLRAITTIAEKYGLLVIEDCAQSHGATLEKRSTGTWGDIAAFSFYPTKNLGALGDGGMVVTRNDDLAEQVRLLRQYGWQDRYVSEIPGTNSRLDELQAAILRVKLRHLAKDNEQRRSIASQYSSLLADTDLILPSERANSRHVYHQFVVRHSQRDLLRSHLDGNGVKTLVHYPVPVHLQPAYNNRLPRGESLAQTELASNEIISLPMFPQLSDDQVSQVCESILQFSTLT